MTSALRKRLYKIITAGLLFTAALVVPFSSIVYFSLLLAAYLIVGAPIIRKSWRNILNGRIFDENLLMTIATLAAFAIRQYPEAVAVMLFYEIGEFFQTYAVNRSRKSIASLMNIRPDSANLLQNGKIETVSPEQVRPGDIILIRPGERIPLDAVIIKGTSSLDTSALTGESLPRDVSIGEAVVSGCVNLSGTLEAKVTSSYKDSTVAKILELVENASAKKANVENLITRFARYYTPVVVILALILAVIPPLLGYLDFRTWIYRAITFLVISCPCALVISVPLSFFGGIGAASRQGILVKGSTYLEALAKIRCLVFDKTGTLTYGRFEVEKIIPAHGSAAELLELAAYAEAHSPHPIALSVKKRYGQKLDLSRLTGDVEELPGLGVKAVIDGKTVYAGNARLMKSLNLKTPAIKTAGTVVYLAADNRYAGCLLIADQLRPEAEKALQQLHAAGVRQTVMLTGDRSQIARSIARRLNIDSVHSELLPADKVSRLEQCLRQYPGEVAFVGDGINDAPSLARADVGIAMGGIGSDAAIEAADVVIMDDKLEKIAAAIRIARKTIGIARENIIFALAVKFLVLGLGAFGEVSIWAAVFADVGVSVIAILNAVRV